MDRTIWATSDSRLWSPHLLPAREPARRRQRPAEVSHCSVAEVFLSHEPGEFNMTVTYLEVYLAQPPQFGGTTVAQEGPVAGQVPQ